MAGERRARRRGIGCAYDPAVTTYWVASLSLVVHTHAAHAQDSDTREREGASEATRSEPRHCAHSGEARWLVEQALAAQIEPTGAELSTSLGLCIPLVEGEGELFDYTHVEPGLSTQVTFGYVNAGGYVEIVPISFLVLRAAMHSVFYFPAAIDGTGYFPLASYDSPFSPGDLPSEAAQAAVGFNAIAAATLQLELPIADRWSVIVVDDVGFEHWSVGDGPLYYNCRFELVLAASDSFLRNDAFVLASIELAGDIALQVGGYSTLRYVPESEYLAHHTGGVVAGSLRRLAPAIAELTLFASIGGYTHHAFRSGVTLVGGVFATYDLGPL
jgi:hypothetical protein